MLTQREQELEKAQNAGYSAFNQYCKTPVPDYNGDKSLQEAWKVGYAKSSAEYNSFWRN